MPLQGAFPVSHIKHWKCPYREHFQLHIQASERAYVGGIFSYTYMALEMALYETFTARHTRY
jgi:hypothetical protein